MIPADCARDPHQSARKTVSSFSLVLSVTGDFHPATGLFHRVHRAESRVHRSVPRGAPTDQSGQFILPIALREFVRMGG